MTLLSKIVDPFQRCAGSAGAMLRDTTGGIAAVVAIVSPVIIGAMGLGAETGYWYLTQRKLQNAADVAAHAAALRLGRGDTQAEIQNLAGYIVGRSDVDMAQTLVGVSTPPGTGAFAGNGEAVEVTLTQTVPRMFSAIYDPTPQQITARAVARSTSGGSGCVLALSTTDPGAITVTGSAAVNLTACDFVSNSGFEMIGNGSNGSANCIQTAGSAVLTANMTTTCAAPRENAGTVADPFGAVPEPQATGACQNGSIGKPNKTNTLTPIEAHGSGMSSMRFCNGLNLKGTVNLDPGLYIIEGGDFRINSNAVINGTDVVFYLADGVEMTFNGTATIDLAGPTAGTYNGVLFFGSRSATSASHKINGNSSTAYQGAMYTPASHIDFQGNNGTVANGCTQIVSDTVTFTGNSGIGVSCSNPTGPTITVDPDVALVE